MKIISAAPIAIELFIRIELEELCCANLGRRKKTIKIAVMTYIIIAAFLLARISVGLEIPVKSST